MKTHTTIMSAAALAAAITLLGPIKESAAGSCPTDLGGSGTRTFNVNPGTCIDYGEGQPTAGDIGSGYVLLDQDEGEPSDGILTIGGIGTTGGDWSYTADSIYKAFVLVLKSGGNDGTPDWGAFALGDSLSGSGNWSIVTKDLSNAQLYAQVVPIPAALPLMLGALAGLGLIARRKKDV